MHYLLVLTTTTLHFPMVATGINTGCVTRALLSVISVFDVAEQYLQEILLNLNKQNRKELTCTAY